MIQDINNPKHYSADKGYTFKRKEDGFIMGNEMYLGKYNLNPAVDDTIENYEEVIDENYVDPETESAQLHKSWLDEFQEGVGKTED